MKLVVLDGYTLNPGDNPWDDVARHGELTVYERTPEALVVERAAGAELLLVNKTPVSRVTIEQLPELRLIAVLATGYDVVDCEAAREHGVRVCNVPEYGTDSVAQFTIGLLLSLCHQNHRHDAAVRAGEWAQREDFSFWLSPQTELAGLTLGVVGFGRIGRRVGELAHALGMGVLARDSLRGEPPGYEPFAWAGLDELVAEADVITLHCPQTPETTGMVDEGLLAQMKRSAFLINTARGGLVKEADLAAALANGQIAGAALDVVSVEPIRADNPLLAAPNTLLTPHQAWSSLAARKRLMAVTAQNLSAFLAGEPIHLVGAT